MPLDISVAIKEVSSRIVHSKNAFGRLNLKPKIGSETRLSSFGLIHGLHPRGREVFFPGASQRGLNEHHLSYISRRSGD